MAGAVTTGKIAVNYLETLVETYESQQQLINLVDLYVPDASDMQDAGNVYWSPIQQQIHTFDGFDATGQADAIIEESVPVAIGQPNNAMVDPRIDNVRNARYFNDHATQSGYKLASNLNKAIGNIVVNTGTCFYRSNAVSGYDFLGEAQTILNERQKKGMGRIFVLNERDRLKFSKDLAARQTLQGQPAKTWKTGQIGENVAEFNVYSGSYLSTQLGGADPATTTTADVSEKPDAGTVDPNTLIVTNIDYRYSGPIAVVDSTAYAIGDIVTFSNGAAVVQSIGIDDKSPSDTAMTFRIMAKPTGTSVTVWPKPIAVDDTAITLKERAYSNISTQILTGATMNRVNTDANRKANIFFEKSSIRVTGGTIPSELLSQFNGMKVITHTLSNGLTMYFLYDANLTTLTVQFRAFIWYGVTNVDPTANGVGLTF